MYLTDFETHWPVLSESDENTNISLFISFWIIYPVLYVLIKIILHQDTLDISCKPKHNIRNGGRVQVITGYETRYLWDKMKYGCSKAECINCATFTQAYLSIQ